MGFFFKKENSGLKQKSIKSESSSAIFLFLTAEDFQRWRVNAKGKGRRKNLTLSIWSSLRCQSQNDSKNYWQVDRSLTFFFFCLLVSLGGVPTFFPLSLFDVPRTSPPTRGSLFFDVWFVLIANLYVVDVFILIAFHYFMGKKRTGASTSVCVFVSSSSFFSLAIIVPREKQEGGNKRLFIFFEKVCKRTTSCVARGTDG